ncbi:DUF5008 domain-containing protein [Lacibacter sp.]|uniref:DUF5008 domain-containing protein n=1 Tax=Lacibacter sp. TaxID=1915409 RepID=UPI002B4B8F05|nr:DUF5008 domain-containing protein [Lacibacter sp.]HLP37531.1 DUF5008 domain-containing protein [Lacibacter sp.]
MTRKNRQIFLGAISCFLVAVLLGSCSKQKVEPVDIYPDPPAVLVKFLEGGPYPAIGSEGSVVKFNVTGLKGKEGQFKFFVHLTEAEIISVEENAITVKVPLGASTGAANVLINGQYYFGPTFTIKGKLSIDASFNTDAYVSNGEINGIFLRSDNTSYFLYGRFSNYQNSATAANPITGMAIVDLNCAYKAVADQMKVGKTGVSGSLTSVIQQPGGQYLLAGSFGSYDTTSNINNITRLTSAGVLETQVVDLINPDPVNFPNDGQATVPSLNGGTTGGITRMFLNSSTGDITLVGNFSSHVSTFYERSTKTGPFVDIVKVRQLIRMKSTGAFDSSFNFNYATKEGYEGGNGFIYDAVQLNDGKIIVVGNFTTYNGTTTNYITRINPTNGLVDATFNPGGVGADGPINKVRYNATTNKLLLVGDFKKYNGQDANGVVMINPDGSADTNFRFGKATGGIPTFAAQLNNGKIIVAGSFSHYNYNYITTPDKSIVRPGFMVLESNGALALGYNNTGLFRGTINDLVQIVINGTPGVILVGDFDRFDGKTVADIVKLRMEN